jgi:hypothetical protein
MITNIHVFHCSETDCRWGRGVDFAATPAMLADKSAAHPVPHCSSNFKGLVGGLIRI